MDSYAEQIRDASDWLLEEAADYGGRMQPLHLTPYISGLPFRIGAFEQLIEDLAGDPRIGFATGEDLLNQSLTGQAAR